MQLKVLKSDGSSEVYLHTKVMGTIGTALCSCDEYQEMRVQNLAEAVTVFLSRKYAGYIVSSGEIFSMILVVLSESGYGKAAAILKEHRLIRQVKRKRIQVCRYHNENGQRLSPRDSKSVTQFRRLSKESLSIEMWNKSIIVEYLQNERNLDRNMARAIAAVVEEKVLRMGCRTLTTSLVRELVNNELLVMQRAEESLTEQNHLNLQVAVG